MGRVTCVMVLLKTNSVTVCRCDQFSDTFCHVITFFVIKNPTFLPYHINIVYDIIAKPVICIQYTALLCYYVLICY